MDKQASNLKSLMQQLRKTERLKLEQEEEEKRQQEAISA
jgi:hypothetical protein